MSDIAFFTPIYLDNPTGVFGRLYNASEALFDFGSGPHYVVDLTKSKSGALMLKCCPPQDVPFWKSLIKVTAIFTGILPLIALAFKMTVHHYNFKSKGDGSAGTPFDPATVRANHPLANALSAAASAAKEEVPKEEGGAAAASTSVKDDPELVASARRMADSREAERVRKIKMGQADALNGALLASLKELISVGAVPNRELIGVFGIQPSQIAIDKRFTGPDKKELREIVGTLTLLLTNYLCSKKVIGSSFASFVLSEFVGFIASEFPEYQWVTTDNWESVIHFVTYKTHVLSGDHRITMLKITSVDALLTVLTKAADVLAPKVEEYENAVAVHNAKVAHLRASYTSEHRNKLFEALVALAEEGGSFNFLEGDFGFHEMSLKAHSNMRWVTDQHARMFNAIAMFALLYLDIHSDPKGSIGGAAMNAYEQISSFSTDDFKGYLSSIVPAFGNFEDEQMYLLFKFLGAGLKDKGFLTYAEQGDADHTYNVQLADFETVIDFFKRVAGFVTTQTQQFAIEGAPANKGGPAALPWALSGTGGGGTRLKALPSTAK